MNNRNESWPLASELTTELMDPSPARGAFIYVVDDEGGLAELYSILLQGMGCVVRAYNDRVVALAALKVEKQRPDLLIMDYYGHTMPVDWFMHRCRVMHPTIRILMASGCGPSVVKSLYLRPNRFLQKPFDAREFISEVRAALEG